jgi:hypothetical protein
VKEIPGTDERKQPGDFCGGVLWERSRSVEKLSVGAESGKLEGYEKWWSRYC